MTKIIKRLTIVSIIFSIIYPISAKADVFRNASYESNDLSGFSKWSHVMNSLPSKNHITNWHGMLADIPKNKGIATIRMVNDAVNKISYVKDQDNWQQVDYWASPDEFIAKGAGDCEDFAITKYMALRKLGWSADSLRIVVLKDTSLNQMHSVLAVREAGKTYILDNQTSNIYSQESVTHYTPIYAINEQAWWGYNSI